MKLVIIFTLLTVGNAIRGKVAEEELQQVAVTIDGDAEYYSAPPRKGNPTSETKAVDHTGTTVDTSGGDSDAFDLDIENIEFDDDDLALLFGEFSESVSEEVKVGTPPKNELGQMIITPGSLTPVAPSEKHTWDKFQDDLQKQQLKSAISPTNEKSLKDAGLSKNLLVASQMIESPQIQSLEDKHEKALELGAALSGSPRGSEPAKSFTAALEHKSENFLLRGLDVGVKNDMVGRVSKKDAKDADTWKKDRAEMWKRMLHLPCHPSHNFGGTTKCCCYRLPPSGRANATAKQAVDGGGPSYKREFSPQHPQPGTKKKLLNQYAYHEARAYFGHCWRDTKYNNGHGGRERDPDKEGTPTTAGPHPPPLEDGITENQIIFNKLAQGTVDNQAWIKDKANWAGAEQHGGSYFARYCGACTDEKGRNMCRSLDKMMARFEIPDNIGGSGW